VRDVNSSFSAAIDLTKVKVCELYIITLTNGISYHYTSHTKNITWDATPIIYESLPIMRSPISQNLNLESQAVDVSLGNITGDLFDLVQKNLLDGCTVTIKRILWTDDYAVDKEIILFVGYGSPEFNRQELVLHCRSILESLVIQVPEQMYQEPCNNCLFDDMCGLIKADYAYSGTATDGSKTTLIDPTRGTINKANFDGGDSANPILIGDTIGAINDFSADANCKALFNLESAALGADSKSTNTLTNSGVAADVADFKQGGCAGVFASSDYMTLADASLSAGFPLKNGDTNKKISTTFWVKFSSLPSTSGYQAIVSKFATSGSKRSFVAMVYNNAGTKRFGFYLGYSSGTLAEKIEDDTVSVAINIWYHVGITYQDSDKSYRIRIYDSSTGLSTEKAGNTTNNIYITDAAFELGRASGGNALQAKLDEVVVLSDILSADEIDEIRNAAYGDSATATVVNIVYLTATSGYIWYVNQTGAGFADNQLLVHEDNLVVVNGTPEEDTTYYELGELHITSGANNGQRRKILSNTASTITVMWAFPYAIVAGVAYAIYPGCDLTGAVCRDRFDNIDNFNGYVYVPKVEETMM